MLRHALHSRCFACGPANASGLRLAFELGAGGTVGCRFVPSSELEGYPQVLHNGLVATLLDAAMAQCLFAQGLSAYPSELTVRYLAPVLTREAVTVEARFLRTRYPDMVLEARLSQGGHCRATARGAYTKTPRVALGLAHARRPKPRGPTP